MFAAATGVVGAYAGIQAFIVSERSLRANILRDEFNAHRQFLQEHLNAIDVLLVGLKQTVNPAMPLERLVTNFGHVQNDVMRRVSAIHDEGLKISERGLFTGDWAVAFRKPTQRIERELDSILDPDKPEGIRRAAANDVVNELEQVVTRLRRMIDDTVKAPLVEGKFHWRWPWSKPKS